MTGRVVLLTGLWLLAWGEISVANVVTGVAVAAALLAAFPPSEPSRRVHLRPAGLVRLVGYVAVQLVSANVVMTREILRRHPTMQPGVLTHTLRQPSEHVVTVMTTVISLSPGTMTADVDATSRTIDVHFLFLRDRGTALRSLAHLEDLAAGALKIRPAAVREQTGPT